MFCQEKSVAARMMYDFATLLEHWDSWKSTTRRFTTISNAGSVQQERMFIPEASNTEQSKESCHQGLHFTLHSPGMDA